MPPRFLSLQLVIFYCYACEATLTLSSAEKDAVIIFAAGASTTPQYSNIQRRSVLLPCTSTTTVRHSGIILVVPNSCVVLLRCECCFLSMTGVPWQCQQLDFSWWNISPVALPMMHCSSSSSDTARCTTCC